MDKFMVMVDGKELECVLNPKNEITKKIIHILCTTLCMRKCKYCCNKLCDKNKIDYVTEEELSECEIICLTGGEPVLFSQPNEIAYYFKRKYQNIKKVYLYANAVELASYLAKGGNLSYIDGITLSIKIPQDISAFDNEIVNNEQILKMSSNLCYYFDDLKPFKKGNFKVSAREWQTLENYKPNPDSIFRKI